MANSYAHMTEERKSNKRNFYLIHQFYIDLVFLVSGLLLEYPDSQQIVLS